MARSLNKVELIGNLTRDPELRYTPQGTAVCTFGVATNRQWTTEAGEKREDAEFHRIVSWNKLAELCAQLLAKGRKVYVEGRLQTRRWTAQDGNERTTTEIVINDMIILDSRMGGPKQASEDDFDVPADAVDSISPSEGEKNKDPLSSKKSEDSPAKVKFAKKLDGKKNDKSTTQKKEDVEEEDIPF